MIPKLKIIVNLALTVLLIWFLAAHQKTMRSNIRGRDSTLYWATAKLLVHAENPYSIPDILTLERSQGYAADKPKMYRPPPWSIWMILPLGMLSAYWAWVAWTAIAVISLVIAIRLLWRMYGEGPNPSNQFLLVAYLFAPVIACLVMAQMGTVLLLGIVLILSSGGRAPLCGRSDLTSLLPAVLQGVLWVSSGKLKLRSQFMILLFACLNLLLLLIVRAKVDPFTGIYFWSSMVWFSWYWYARSFSQEVHREVSQS